MHSVQGNVGQKRQSCYYVALTELLNILNIEILKYVKLKTIKLTKKLMK